LLFIFVIIMHAMQSKLAGDKTLPDAK